jgi:hypothetical protein
MVTDGRPCAETSVSAHTARETSVSYEYDCEQAKQKLRRQCVPKRKFGNEILVLVSLAVASIPAPECRAQNDVAEPREENNQPAASATGDEAAADDQQKQRTAASALATLAGIVLAGLALVFVILLLGAWTRRIVKARQAASADKSDSTGGRPTEPPGEDET